LKIEKASKEINIFIIIRLSKKWANCYPLFKDRCASLCSWDTGYYAKKHFQCLHPGRVTSE